MIGRSIGFNVFQIESYSLVTLMYNQQTQGNTVPQVRENPQPVVSGKEGIENGENKRTSYSDYQNIQQGPRQALSYTTMQEAVDEYNNVHNVSSGFVYANLHDARNLYYKQQQPYIPQSLQEKQGNGKGVHTGSAQYVQMKPSQLPDLGVTQLSYLPYQYPQQHPGYSLSVGGVQYVNGNYGAVPMQAQSSVKREVSSVNTAAVENMNKKQQVAPAESVPPRQGKFSSFL